MHEILFLTPVLKEAVWGGRRLGDDYGYPIPSDHTGEAWAISAHPNGDCTVRGGVFDGTSLSTLWRTRRDLFGHLPGDRFPLLTKIIDANADLSLQVHPDDAYARTHENGSLGKTECWYVLDCAPDATVVIGHHARDKAELTAMIREKRWGEFIREIPLHPGDFFQIEPGCLHAIKAGTLILETQQNSDITYRVYDYDRLADGKLRPLHVEQSIAVLTAPFAETATAPTVTETPGLRTTHLVTCPYYTVARLDITAPVSLPQTAPFLCVSIIDGTGSIDGHPLTRGDHFLLPATYGEAHLDGRLSLITTTV